MKLPRARWIAWALLSLYALALLHQLVPHGDGHAADDCPLCLLLYTTAIAAVGLILLSVSRAASRKASPGHIDPALSSDTWRSPPLRAPPSLPH